MALGKALSLEVIAEGVETEEQRACVAALGCDHMQGFLFAKPLEQADAELLLEASSMQKETDLVELELGTVRQAA